MWQKQQVGNPMTCARLCRLSWMKSEASEFAERKLQSCRIQSKWKSYSLAQKVWKASKFESSRRVIVAVVKSAAENKDHCVTQTLCQNYSP